MKRHKNDPYINNGDLQVIAQNIPAKFETSNNYLPAYRLTCIMPKSKKNQPPPAINSQYGLKAVVLDTPDGNPVSFGAAAPGQSVVVVVQVPAPCVRI